MFKIDQSNLVEQKVKTTPQNVAEANQGRYRAKLNLRAAAKHCGMTEKEMKMTFLEFLKYNKPDYESTEDTFEVSRRQESRM